MRCLRLSVAIAPAVKPRQPRMRRGLPRSVGHLFPDIQNLQKERFSLRMVPECLSQRGNSQTTYANIVMLLHGPVELQALQFPFQRPPQIPTLLGDLGKVGDAIVVRILLLKRLRQTKRFLIATLRIIQSATAPEKAPQGT